MAVLRLTFWENAILFSAGAASFYSPTNRAQGCQFLHMLTNTCCFLWFVAILMDMQWYLILSPCLDQQRAVQHSRVAYWGSRWVSNGDNTSWGWGAGLQGVLYVWNHKSMYQHTLLLLIAGMETVRWRWDSLSIKGAGSVGYPYAKKMDIELNLTPYTKVNTKWIGFKCET